jgi:hypothetical protein
MYRIITQDNEPLPEVDIIPRKLILHPAITAECIKLITYIIDEYLHDANRNFKDCDFEKHTGVKRDKLRVAKNLLLDLQLLDIYNDAESGERIYQLDYSGLIELIGCASVSVLAKRKQLIDQGKKKNEFYDNMVEGFKFRKT